MTEVIANITNDRDDYMESFVDEDLYDWKDTGKVLQYIGEDIWMCWNNWFSTFGGAIFLYAYAIESKNYLGVVLFVT